MAYIYKSSNQEQAFFGDITELLGNVFYTSKLVKLEASIDWEMMANLVSGAYSRIGRKGIDLRVMIGLQILKSIKHGISDIELVNSLKTDLEVMYFCGIRNISDANKELNSSSMTKFRNRVNSVAGIMEKIQDVHIETVVKAKVPMVKRGQYDQDSTVIEERITYPNDVDLLSKVAEVSTRLIKKGKKLLGSMREKIKSSGEKEARRLQLSYHFSKEKGVEKIKEIKESLIEIGSTMNQQMVVLHNDLKYIGAKGNKKAQSLRAEREQHLSTCKTIFHQQTELLKEGVTTVKDRILSLHKPYLRPIIKGKKGKPIEIGAKVQIGVIGGMVSMLVQHGRSAVNDSTTVQTGIELYQEIRGKKPREAGFDKGYRASATNDPYLEKAGILNGIQGSQSRKDHTKSTRKRLYNRRAGVERLINDIKNHRGSNKNLLKESNAKGGLLWAIMASNYVRLYI